MKHITVLQNEAVTALALREDCVVCDATLGAAGHAQAIVESLGQAGTFIGIDADQTAIDHATSFLKTKATVHLVKANFRDLRVVLKERGIDKVDAILADLGWHTDQFTDGKRGFSFNDPDPLMMTYGNPEDYPFVASDIVNGWDEEDIANVLYGYGEERYSRRIAKLICERRTVAPIMTAVELADIVETAVPAVYRHGKIHAATKTFQALRIAVNDEFATLEFFIKEAWSLLKPNGRIAIITFHSLEDRIVKHLFRSFVQDDTGVLVVKKPITPSPEERTNNPRSRSAKLRIIQKL